MADPIKPLDRNKPFKRINNQDFLRSSKPDGKGVACGCHTPNDFKDQDEAFEKFLEDKNPILKNALKALDILDKILNPAELVKLLIDAVKQNVNIPGAAELLTALAAATSLAAFLGKFLNPLSPIVSAVNKAVKEVIHIIVSILARRILNRAIRVIPQWVPVLKGASNTSVSKDQVIEVEGICTRSFGNPIDVPLTNWHQWFAWNVQVQPEPDYVNVPSEASDPPNTTNMDAAERPITKSGSFEIQWDPGAFESAALRAERTPGFKEEQMPLHEGPMLSIGPESAFLWPMAGMFVWASGRHVYDCSRVSDDSADPLMCAIINPARAVATARWTAANFIENGSFSVPAIQFLFIASKRGGYINHNAMADSDYEFIIDLPPIDLDVTPFPIGHTENFPHNTITLRPRLLKDLRFLPNIDSSSGEPIVQPIRPDDPTKPPAQVKVTVPQSILSGSDAYGFTLTMGWFDPSHVQSKKVKVCTLTLDSIQMRLTDRDNPAKKVREIFKKEEQKLKDELKKRLDAIVINVPFLGAIHPLQLDPIGPFIEKAAFNALDAVIKAIIDALPTEDKEEWLLRIGVNGLWTSHFFEPSLKQTFPMRGLDGSVLEFQFQSVVGDPIFFASHGSEFDPVGDIMHSDFNNRVLKFRDPAVPVPWEKIVNPDSEQQRHDMIFDYSLRMMLDTTQGVTKLSLGFDNSPLGLIDPDPANAGPSQQNNPMIVGDNFDSAKVQRLAHFARAEGDQFILFESTGDNAFGFPNKPDYDIRATLEIKDLIPKN